MNLREMYSLEQKRARHIYYDALNEFSSKKNLFTENEIIAIMAETTNNINNYSTGCYKETLIEYLKFNNKHYPFGKDFVNFNVLYNKIDKTPESVICMLIRRIHRYNMTGNNINFKTSELIKHLYEQHEDNNMELLIRYILEDNISKILEFQKKIANISTKTAWDILSTLDYINLEYWTEYIKIYYRYQIAKDKMHYFKDLIFDKDKSNEDIFQEVNPIILSVFKNELIQRRIIDIFAQESNPFNRITYKFLNDLKKRITNVERITQGVCWQVDGIIIVFYDTVLRHQLNIKFIFSEKEIINHEGDPENVRYIEKCEMF